MPEFSWRPVNDATSTDLEAVFDAGGARECRLRDRLVSEGRTAGQGLHLGSPVEP